MLVFPLWLHIWQLSAQSLLATCVDCPMLESQEILASSPLRTVQREEGAEGEILGTVQNIMLEEKRGWKSWLLSSGSGERMETSIGGNSK